MLVTVIGLGLIGGSLALELKKRLGYTVYGVDTNPENAQKALELGIIDKIITLQEIGESDIVVLAVPVNYLSDLANQVLNFIKNDAIVFDMGSTKEKLCKTVENHEKRSNFVAVHPIAGTEHSGPEAAIYNLFDHKVNIICDKELSSPDAIAKVLTIFEALQMRTTFMNSVEHDKHIAYVSHLSHISSFMLGKTVLEKEKNEKNIFDMAGSGFESTVRLAKSSPNMWSPIFIENKENILSSLNEYIDNLITFKNLIIQENSSGLQQTMKETNHIKEVLKGIQK
ncbi:prephenate dehydrogenase [Wenyingzhuangia aestuarii]|uniref:prephenate dehydrogenase n=1 Tax=Wenyingzhuangia aestuarii TaxID=1647582 RepID=UPI00143B56B0|nr:prephenate dehydrogenase [Wenyingzhuangia aestuarii]NJB83241.1 prephenate dehydrogenase [Wenyingzhuangia aestuarii]